MKNYTELPPVRDDKILCLDHFPTRMQAFIFRMWEMVPKKRLAMVLKTSEENIQRLADEMGLLPQENGEEWLQKGYITIIRNSWHILPYNQLLELLGWDEKKLAYILKEEDFLINKLGRFKPYCQEVFYRELTAFEKAETARIKELLSDASMIIENSRAPFDFFSDRYENTKKCLSNFKYDVTVTDEWTIDDKTNAEETKSFVKLFIDDFSKDWGISLAKGSSNPSIELILINVNKGDEYHEIEITDYKIKISAKSPVGVLRGLFHLKDLAKQAGGPFYNKTTYKRSPRFENRIIYSYCGLYGTVFDEPHEVSYPDELLHMYANAGINGIWTQAVLYKLTEFPFEPQLSDGWQSRLDNLEKLVNKAKKYGIKVYLYINEPRAMPLGFFEKHKEILGHVSDDMACMCTSKEVVLKYLSDAITTICAKVPEIGGFFTITCSENLTNCYSKTTKSEINCFICKDREPSDIISEINNTVISAATKVNPNIKMIAWTWSWVGRNLDRSSANRCIDQTLEDVTIMCTSEEAKEYSIAGISGEVVDYTMSIIGPSDRSLKTWEHAKKTGHRTAAKVQINNTWECSSVPFIPVYGSILKQMQNLLNAGVDDLMLSWTLGGYPSDNLKIVSGMFFDDNDSFDMLKVLYGEHYEVVKNASNIFCNAFAKFPFSQRTLYLGPQNAGVSNLLYEKPTGFSATMTCYAYDDLNRWKSDKYPLDIFENQFKLMSSEWKKGLDLLSGLPQSDLLDVSQAVYCIFKSSYNQIKYIRLRDENLKTSDKSKKKEMIEILKDEISLAKDLYKIMMRNPCIGYEAANHYYYNRSQILESIINCNYLIKKLED